jgi:hypothetical protein
VDHPLTPVRCANSPIRHKYLDEALGHLAAQPDVWLTTSDDIAAHFLR